MNTPIKHQVITGPDGNPLYAVIPWAEFEEYFEQGRPDDEVTIPFEVAELHLDGASLIRAWREYLKLTQDEVAKRMGVTRPAFAQMEAQGVRPRVATLKKIAEAMGVEWEQLRDE